MSSFRENNTDKTNRTGENNTGFVFLNSVEVKQNDNYGKTEPDQNGDDRSGKGNAPAKILLISGGAILLLARQDITDFRRGYPAAWRSTMLPPFGRQW